MSKKVIGWLIADTVFAGLVTWGIIAVRDLLASAVQNHFLHLAIMIAGTAAFIIVDGIILFYFLLYWWSDKKWTQIKRKFGKK